MPTYEYKREDGSTFEIFQSMSEDALKVCPTTGQPVKRMISGGTGLVFKGSGFYVTDYKNGKSKGGAEGSSSSETSASKDDKKETPAKKESADKKKNTKDSE